MNANFGIVGTVIIVLGLNFSTTALARSAQQPGKATDRAKTELMVSVKEPVWNPHVSEASLEIFRTRVKAGYEYRMEMKRKGVKTSTRPMTETQYIWARDKFLGIILDQEAKRAPAASNGECMTASYLIQLQQLGEKGKICAGDHRGYFQTRAVVSELQERQ
ncbi:MAG: hypothetical protein A2428_02585 [Bdellovibrionales bacterium RIFOXYC1_FULL_54_43]|nr:MAG: hypothetical protein A2428_02585 [Bdellovibrionales bacterium RIFOXYC1_FULL_54_43]OFZ82573.1 MAG: hypothetical protein A2603_15040 [Bdellovibrionales bacterium RIFOXYD1_FULL_55_31]